jgi:hypothetical protein
MYRSLLLLLVWTVPLSATVVEYSPIANALNGVTMLSDSPADYALSPVIGVAGVASFYHKLFNTPGISVYGLHSAIDKDPLILALGTTYLDSPDYRYYDPYISLSLNLDGAALGYTQHLVYDSIQGSDASYRWLGDVALKIDSGDYGSEIKYIRMGSDDAQLHLTASAVLSEGIETATAYVWEPKGNSYFCASASTSFSSYFALYSSWRTDSARFGMGLRIIVEGFSVIYAVRSHPELDLSHSFGFEMHW